MRILHLINATSYENDIMIFIYEYIYLAIFKKYRKSVLFWSTVAQFLQQHPVVRFQVLIFKLQIKESLNQLFLFFLLPCLLLFLNDYFLTSKALVSQIFEFTLRNLGLAFSTFKVAAISCCLIVNAFFITYSTIL